MALASDTRFFEGERERRADGGSVVPATSSGVAVENAPLPKKKSERACIRGNGGTIKMWEDEAIGSI